MIEAFFDGTLEKEQRMIKDNASATLSDRKDYLVFPCAAYMGSKEVQVWVYMKDKGRGFHYSDRLIEGCKVEVRGMLWVFPYKTKNGTHAVSLRVYSNNVKIKNAATYNLTCRAIV